MAGTGLENLRVFVVNFNRKPVARALTTAAGFLMIVATNVAYGQPCPDGWELHGTKCYSFLKQGKNWEQSRTYCAGIGGSLVVLESANETDYIVGKIRAYDAHTFLGCRDVVTEGHWVCEGYDPATTYFDEGGSSAGHWQAGEPFDSIGGNTENCMEIYHTQASSWTNDVSCSTVNPLVSCQRDPVVYVTTPSDPTTSAKQPSTRAPDQDTTALPHVTTAPRQQTTQNSLKATTARAEVNAAPYINPAWFNSPKGPGHCLMDHVVTELTTRLTLGCALRCKNAQWCISFNRIHGGDGQFMTCQLNNALVEETTVLQEAVGCTTFNKLLE